MTVNRALVATLALSAAGFVGITTYEGFRSDAYNDGVGVTTIGFGSTAGVKPGDRITVERALVTALADATRHGEEIKKCIKVPLYQTEFDAYSSFAYNVGTGAFCGSTLLKKLNSGDYPGACAELSRWVKAGGKVLPGLVKRRAAERKLCETVPEPRTLVRQTSTP